MRQRTLLLAALALLIVPAGVLILILRQPSAGDQAIPPTPRQVIEKAPPVPEPVDLGAVLGLDRLAGCELAPALGSILEHMVQIDPPTFESSRGGPIGVAGYDRPIVPTFERRREIANGADTRAVTAELDLPGRWHGLSVTGLRRSFYEESDASAFDIRFAEPPERVRDVLIRHGFRLPPVGEMRVVNAEEEGISTEIGISAIEGGAALTCATG